MKFNLLLFGLLQVLRVAALTKKGFKKHIRNTKVRLMIKTRDNSHGRLFLFDRGRISSCSGADHDFDVALVFRDADTGFAVMSDRAPDAVFNAAARGDIRLEGMSAWAMWFEEATKLAL